MATTIRTAVVPVGEIFALRWGVLRGGLPRESAVFAEDEDPDAFHLAAYGPDTAPLGCGSFFREPFTGAPGAQRPPDAHAPAPDAEAATAADTATAADAAYRIRGMATAEQARGRGYGTAVLRAGVVEAVARGARLLWCTGRTDARGFYERHGFAVSGAEFVIEGVGPHVVLVREIG
ncbi:N-acetyltransferase [Streptomyces armeniacus]|uniref:N-acetyltransferase n=1 Tax=Streptomyces armeniacus TaxID=83291 RepID=A0A345XT03_9ACTN|nr:GNAT family N-acetyltransferase [Streptomyces armeniacus]AXK34769.1 N-acetyltransferase [Streptomyces armeniacus]